MNKQPPSDSNSLLISPPALIKRRRRENRFKIYGILAIVLSLGILFSLLTTIVIKGTGAFFQSFITMEVELSASRLDKKGNRDLDDIKKVSTFGYKPLFNDAFTQLAEDLDIKTDIAPKQMAKILSNQSAAQLRQIVLASPELIGEKIEVQVLANSWIDGYIKGRVHREAITNNKHVTSTQLDFVDELLAAGVIEKKFNSKFITGADASDQRPEAAGIGVAAIGSLMMILVVIALCVPVGVGASIYLEEFAPKNKFTDVIEVSIANLAALPSIVFGILGLAVFINFMHLPQSAPIVGGLVLTLMTLPTIIISTRAALKSVPPSIRSAALGLGASKMQLIFHHVLPLATPGILTGTIIGVAQALGETAPLLLIGMVGYIATNIPTSVTEGLFTPNSAVSAQIYEWAKRADPAFYERAWGGIIILLLFLISINLIAIILRHKFERRW